jgi:MoaA/NifB/PqqE/SkfB family radical SAM enzyme
MCYIWQNPTLPENEISLKTLEKVPSGIDNLNITGGEPTLRKDLAEIVDILYPKARILEISSNGLHAPRLIPIIKKYPDIKVRFSLEGFNETNDRIRGEKDGFDKKVSGLLMLQEAGGTDLGFATVIQDENIDELVKIYEFAQNQGFELATSALHNAFQFHKADNFSYDRVRVARGVEGLINGMLKTNSVKNWFRAYLNLGLMEKILGHDRLIACTAATDFAFVDPWSDVYACNVRPDLKLGNLEEQTWEEIWLSQKMTAMRSAVAVCQQNCWMVGSARTAMRSHMLPSLPKPKPLIWVVKNKIRSLLGRGVNFEDYIDYRNHAQDDTSARRASFLGIKTPQRKLQVETSNYIQLGEIHNR